MSPAILLVLVAASAAPGSAPAVTWRPIASGVEYAAIALEPRPAIGDGVLHVVRVDPKQARVRALAVSQLGGTIRPAQQWCADHKLVAVINAGMYETDFSTHTGFFKLGPHVNAPRWVKKYQSLLLLGPRQAGLPGAELRDAASDATAASHVDHETVIQNLRLIRDPGVNVWQQSDRRWSEAAIAMDRDGKLLLLFCRSPYSMRDFNRIVLALPLGVVRAMHVEGGPEASLSVHGHGVDLDLAGSYETGFNENDDNRRQWPIPNVIGVEVGP